MFWSILISNLKRKNPIEYDACILIQNVKLFFITESHKVQLIYYFKSKNFNPNVQARFKIKSIQKFYLKLNKKLLTKVKKQLKNVRIERILMFFESPFPPTLLHRPLLPVSFSYVSHFDWNSSDYRKQSYKKM